MTQKISLKEVERKAFRVSYDDGLWDVLLGCFFMMFAIAPLLSASLGDFWSSMIFLPFWGLVYLVIHLIRKYVVVPRIGVVKLGHMRKDRLAKFSLVMLVVNMVALVLGIAVAMNFSKVPGQIIPITFGLILLLGFSVAAFLLDFNRLYIYGLLIAFSPLVGEWLYKNAKAAHHGFPIAFGVTSSIMILVGVAVFVRLLRDNPIPREEFPSEKA